MANNCRAYTDKLAHFNYYRKPNSVLITSRNTNRQMNGHRFRFNWFCHNRNCYKDTSLNHAFLLASKSTCGFVRISRFRNDNIVQTTQHVILRTRASLLYTFFFGSDRQLVTSYAVLDIRKKVNDGKLTT